MTTRAQPRAAEARGSLWQPDGAGWRARIGVLAPHFDGVPESECWTMAPPGVSIYAARVPVDARVVDARAFAQPPHVDTAAELLAAAPLHAIIYAFTSSSYLLGSEADTALKARLEQRTHGIPVVIPAVAAVEALRACGLRRLALILPPWFRDEVTQAGATYFRGHGFDVVHAGSVEPARGFSEVPVGELYEWARKQVPAEADAVFFGGNGLRAIGVIQALEEDLDCTVLSANQVALWQALRYGGTHAPVDGYGRLFTQQVKVDSQAQ
jgi:maleate isomerase